jgi:uncharacterized glyoxalase superfamily protein PhnB
LNRSSRKAEAPKLYPAMPAIGVIPSLLYRDARKAVEFLCTAFGFTKKVIHEGDQDIEHAELLYGNGLVMLSPVSDSEFSRMQLRPQAAGGVTMSVYVVVDNVDDHCERARNSGAEVVMPPHTQSYGGRDYTARDPEGHLWTFGDYDPMR